MLARSTPLIIYVINPFKQIFLTFINTSSKKTSAISTRDLIKTKDIIYQSLFTNNSLKHLSLQKLLTNVKFYRQLMH